MECQSKLELADHGSKKMKKYKMFGLLALSLFALATIVIFSTTGGKPSSGQNVIVYDEQGVAQMIWHEGPLGEGMVGAQAKDAMIYPGPVQLDTETRALIHISTDKPFYKPNEVVFIETFLIDSITKAPLFAGPDDLYNN